MKGEHVMRHRGGVWYGIWSDMMVETTFMRYGKGNKRSLSASDNNTNKKHKE